MILGVLNLGKYSLDADSMTTPGFYYSSGSFIFVLRHLSYTNIVWQFLFGWSGDPYLKIRYSTDTGENWTDWKEFVSP